ncbi:AbrB/MazE/SpoVT family DNA-binding domain-containing protein [Archaeoglobus sp.]
MKVKVDKFGRIVIPKEIRNRLGIHENTELTLTVKDDEIVLKIQRNDLEKRVDELINFLKNNAPKPFVAEVKGEEKWLTKDYSLKKIGLKE